MANIDDRHFRFSGNLHGIDWKKVTKSCIPYVNDARINYMMSLAGAVSLNPLILITSVVVDDTLSQSPTIIGDRSFYQSLNQYAENLIRSHLEYEAHPINRKRKLCECFETCLEKIREVTINEHTQSNKTSATA